MNLNKYWRGLKPEEKNDFAEALNLSYQYCSDMCRGLTNISIERCLQIHGLSGGEVDLESLDPKVNWEYVIESKRLADAGALP